MGRSWDARPASRAKSEYANACYDRSLARVSLEQGSKPAAVLALLLVLAAAGCGTSAHTAKHSAATQALPVPPATVSTPTSTIPGIDTALPPTTERGTIITSAIPKGQKVRGDGDADNPGDIDGNGDIDPEDNDSDEPVPSSYRFPDSDDRPVFEYGKPARGAARGQIAAVIKRYYAAGTADNGAGACQVFMPLLAKGAAQEYTLPGQSHHYPTCAALMTAMFAQSRQELAAPVTVVAVRVHGHEAHAVVASRTLRASYVELMRQGGSWRLLAIGGEVLP